MRKYRIVKVIASVITPIAINSSLHLDSLISAVHPAMYGNNKLSKFDVDDKKIAIAPIPLMSAYCGNDWVWLATAAEFPDCAKMSNDSLIKMWGPEDIDQSQRVVRTSEGALRNRFITFTTILTPEIYFYAATYDVKELNRLLNRIASIGRLRKSGYGMISNWTVEIINIPWKELLIINEIARRNIPKSFALSGTAHQIRTTPPYWHNSNKKLGFEAGEKVILSDEIKIRGQKGIEYEFSPN